MVLLLVGLVFTGMAVYIKVTYFVGFRAGSASRKSPSSPYEEAKLGREGGGVAGALWGAVGFVADAVVSLARLIVERVLAAVRGGGAGGEGGNVDAAAEL